jgi:hypothetical protein
LVICCVDLTARIRRRISMSEGICADSTQCKMQNAECKNQKRVTSSRVMLHFHCALCIDSRRHA